MHMLNIRYQPLRHTSSWDISITHSRRQVKDTIEENPSLKSHLKRIINKAYGYARLEATVQTGLEEKTFPNESPWTIEEILEGEK